MKLIVIAFVLTTALLVAAQTPPVTTVGSGMGASQGLDSLSNGDIVNADWNTCLYKLKPDGTVISFSGCVGGFGNQNGPTGDTSQYNRPRGVAVDSKDNIFFVDRNNGCIRLIDKDTGGSTTFTGKCGTRSTAFGSASQTRMTSPITITIDRQDNLYVFDTSNGITYKVKPDGSSTQYADHGNNHIQGLAIINEGDTLYAFDSTTNQIMKVSPSGTITAWCGTGGGGATNGDCSSATFDYMANGVIDAATGDLYLASYSDHRIRKITPFGTVSTLTTSVTNPFGIGINVANGNLIIGEYTGNVRAMAMGLSRAALSANPPPPSPPTPVPPLPPPPPPGTVATVGSGMGASQGLDGLSNGDIVNADWNTCLYKVKPDGTVISFSGCVGGFGNQNGPTGASAQYNRPRGVAVDSKDNIFFVDRNNGCIRLIDKDTGGSTTFTGKCGTRTTAFGSASQTRMSAPITITIDRQDNLYVFDTDNGITYKVKPDGSSTQYADHGNNHIQGLAIINEGDTLYAFDSTTKQIMKVSPTGTITAWCGTGSGGATNGDCISATFDYMANGVIDAATGDLYLASYSDHRIRKITAAGVVSTLISGPGSADGPAASASVTNPFGLGINPVNGDLLIGEYSGKVRTVALGLTRAASGTPAPPTPVPPTPVPPTPAPPTPNPAACSGPCLLNACNAQNGHPQLFDITVVGVQNDILWGTGYYSDDSDVGAAAVHSNQIAVGETKTLTAKCLGPQTTFESSTNNGITSKAFGPWDRSFTFFLLPEDTVPPVPAPEQCFREPCLINKCTIQGTQVTIVVAGTTDGSRVWGSHIFTDDSTVGAAAVHMGILTNGATGAVTATCTGSHDAYQGTTNNGVTTQSFGSWQYSYSLAPGPATPPPSTAANVCHGACLDGHCTTFGEAHHIRVTGTTYGYGWGGNDAYTSDTDVGLAAVHKAMVAPGATGAIIARCTGPQASFTGSTANDVTTKFFDAWPGSFEVHAAPASPTFQVCAGQCLHNVCRIQGELKYITVTGTTGGTVWGTSIYSDDSDVSTAAVHAGLITAGETKNLVAVCTGAQTSFESTQNGGVTTLPYGPWAYSFSLE